MSCCRIEEKKKNDESCLLYLEIFVCKDETSDQIRLDQMSLTLKDPVKSNVIVDDMDRLEVKVAFRKAGLAMRPSIIVAADVKVIMMLLFLSLCYHKQLVV